MSSAVKKRKIAVLGSRSVGKSSLVNKFVTGEFVEAYFPTIEATYIKNIVYNGVEYECDIIDTPGQDEFTLFNAKYAIGIHGYILVYSIANDKSYANMKIIYDKIIECWGVAKIACVIVGSKCDLQKRPDSNTGESFAKEVGGAWIESSAKCDINIDKVFELCLQEIEKNTAPESEPAKSSKTIGDYVYEKCTIQ